MNSNEEILGRPYMEHEIKNVREYINKLLAGELGKNIFDRDGDVTARLNRVMEDLDWVIWRWYRPGSTTIDNTQKE